MTSSYLLYIYILILLHIFLINILFIHQDFFRTFFIFYRYHRIPFLNRYEKLSKLTFSNYK